MGEVVRVFALPTALSEPRCPKCCGAVGLASRIRGTGLHLPLGARTPHGLNAMPTGQRSQFRFGLRFLFAAITLTALVVVSGPYVLFYLDQYVALGCSLLAIGAYVLVRWLHVPAESNSPRPKRNWQLWLLPAIASLLVAVAVFCRYRWLVVVDDPLWPRPYPYPDQLLVDWHNWWDRLHPPPPDTFKIHGEHYTVLRFLNVIVASACALLGTVCGFCFPDVSVYSATSGEETSG